MPFLSNVNITWNYFFGCIMLGSGLMMTVVLLTTGDWSAKVWASIVHWPPIYWLLCHTTRRYHVIDISSPQNGWTHGWRDTDDRIEFACWALFVDFVENEMNKGCIDWDWCEEARNEAKVIRELYRWWTVERQLEEEAIHKLLEQVGYPLRVDNGDYGRHPAVIQYNNAIKTWEAKDKVMFDKLLSIRHTLWT